MNMSTLDLTNGDFIHPNDQIHVHTHINYLFYYHTTQLPILYLLRTNFIHLANIDDTKSQCWVSRIIWSKTRILLYTPVAIPFHPTQNSTLRSLITPFLLQTLKVNLWQYNHNLGLLVSILFIYYFLLMNNYTVYWAPWIHHI